MPRQLEDGSFRFLEDGQSGRFLENENVLEITQQPVDISGNIGQIVTFKVYALGTEPLTYQWYEVGVGAIVGETTNKLDINITSSSMDGRQFYVEVDDALSPAVTSNTVTLTVTVAPVEEIVDVCVLDPDGIWVSIVGPPGDPGDLIDDTKIVTNLTWSSDKINREIENAQPHELLSQRHIDVNSNDIRAVRDGLFVDETTQLFNLETRLNFRRPYDSTGLTVYYPDDTVVDGSWTMVANKITVDRAAPQPVGVAGYLYQGTDPTAPVTAKQIVFGTRYTTPADLFYQIQKYRIFVVTGNVYQIFTVEDPGGAGIISSAGAFTADTTGWVEFAASGIIVGNGLAFDIIAVVQEPDPTPTTFTGNWNYLTPNNVTIPASGQIQHANQATSEFRIHKTDNDGGDRSTDLAGLAVGDIIDWGGGGTRWAIQSIQDQGTWYNFGVAPASQEAPDGVRNLTFETVTATPITRLEDVNYWGLNPAPNGTVEGLYVEDDGYDNIVANTNAYGVDVFFQQYQQSEDWDILATSAASATGGGTAVASPEPPGVAVTNVTLTTDQTWTEVAREPIATDEWFNVYAYVVAERVDVDGPKYSSASRAMTWYDGPLQVDGQTIWELGQTNLDVRIVADGTDAVVEVRGRNGQTWSWSARKYVVPIYAF